MKVSKNFANFVVILCMLHTIESETVTEDAIIVEAIEKNGSDESSVHRDRRHLLVNYPQAVLPLQASWASNGLGEPCITSKGILATCQTFKACYPFFKVPEPVIKFPNLNPHDYWILGNYDTCSYYTETGRQAFGVCCTNPINPPAPVTSEESNPDDQKVDLPNRIPAVQNVNAIYGGWPPPIPTHPPDHAAPTHPPSLFGIQGNPPAQRPVGTTTSPATTTTWPTRPQFPSSTTSQRPTFVVTPPNIASEDSFADSSCGARNGSPDQIKIVGGQNADPQEWPWIAVLFNGARQFCGGSLIDDIHVLSAAHCVAHFSAFDVARLTVRLGDYNIRISTEVKHIERRVKRIVRHKGFDSRTLYNDISILTLDTRVPFSKGIRPVCLPSPGSGLFDGKTATAVGWGSLRENGPQPSVLQEVTLPIWTNGECRRKYGPSAPGGIIDSMLCAGQAAKDSCSGDSGPLVVNNGGERWTQVGIVSWGIGCGKGQYPGVYTRVTSFLPWIEKNTKGD